MPHALFMDGLAAGAKGRNQVWIIAWPSNFSRSCNLQLAKCKELRSRRELVQGVVTMMIDESDEASLLARVSSRQSIGPEEDPPALFIFYMVVRDSHVSREGGRAANCNAR